VYNLINYTTFAGAISKKEKDDPDKDKKQY
jgi:hypothetical protein